jgi:large subunit ribosomal protein L29
MPILRIKDIRGMSSEDRSKRLAEFRTELLRLKTMISAGGTVDNPARVRQLRRAVAKILTIEREQQAHMETPGKSEKEVAKKPEKKNKAKPEKGKKK